MVVILLLGTLLFLTHLPAADVFSLARGTSVSNSSFNNFSTTRIFDLSELGDVITAYMRERRIPGASIAVSRAGQFLVRKGYGSASAQRIMTPWALMRIGSVSKVVTAIGILRLHDQRRLDLDAKVFGTEGILSSFDVMSPGRDRLLLNVTVRHLLQHTAGWDHRQVGDPLFQKDLVATTTAGNNQSVDLSKDSIVEFMLNKSLAHIPGTRYSYSNFGFMLLGLIIERISGDSYESFTREFLRLLGVYRMKIGNSLKEDADISEVEYFSRYPSDRVQSVFNDTQLVPPPYGGFNMSLIDSSCGWIASASDLVRLIESLSYFPGPRTFLGNATASAMLARPAYVNSSSVWYGLGVVVEDEGRSYWHSGTLDGSTSVVAHDQSGFTWAALVNCKIHPNDLGDFMRYAIWRVFLRPQHPDDDDDDDDGRGEGRENCLAPGVATPGHRLVDSISSNGKSLVKLMIPDFRFADVLAEISPRLFRLTWIDAYEDRGRVFFNAVWTENEGAARWRAYVDLTSSRYRKRYKARVAQGYRLSHVETYVCRRRLCYAAIFVKDEWLEWRSYEGHSLQRHRAEFFRLLRDGFRLVVQSVTEYKGQVYVAAVYDRLYLGEIRVRLGLNLDEFGEELERQVSSGRILSYVQAYENRGQVKFSAVWSPRTTRYWAVSQAMTKYTMLNKLQEYAVVNVPLACVTAYHSDEVLYFAALWR